MPIYFWVDDWARGTAAVGAHSLLRSIVSRTVQLRWHLRADIERGQTIDGIQHLRDSLENWQLMIEIMPDVSALQ